MAIAGDIVIKLAADFAQFAEGMAQGVKSLDDFGKQAEKTNASIESAIGWLKGLAGAAAVSFVINKVTAYTNAIDAQALAVAKLQKQYKLSAIEVQALQAVAEKTGRAFGELVETAGKNPAWLESIILNARTAGTALDENVVRTISDMDEKSTEATKKINAMFAPFYATTKAAALENIANTLSDIIGMMDRAANHEGFWAKMGSIFNRPGVFDPATGQAREQTEREKDLQDIERASERVKKAQAEIDAATARGDSFARHDAVRAAELAAANRQLLNLQNAQTMRAARAAAGITGNSETDVPIPKTLDPVTVTGTRGGGGGGRTDLETVEALMVRYKAMQDAADAASRAVRGDITTDIKDLSIAIEAKQAAAEAIGKLVARGINVPEGKLNELERAIFLSKQAQAEQARNLQFAVQADATNKRLSGSTEGLRDAVQNLNRQYVSGRLGVVAYERALAEVAEQQEHVRLQATRMDNNIGSLVAGFQDAALSYARANDNFAQGGQLFNAVTGAMGEGLDVLSGKSTKTFSQIASDFATMLTKMALQAALSPVLKYLSNSIGSLFGPGGVTPPPLGGTDTGSFPTARAGGGAAYGGQPYWVGEYGPERFVPAGNGNIEPAGGGDVYVNIANYTDSKVSASKGKGPGGKTQINVIVEAVENQMAGRVSRGQGALGKTMEGTYGLQRVGR